MLLRVSVRARARAEWVMVNLALPLMSLRKDQVSTTQAWKITRRDKLELLESQNSHTPQLDGGHIRLARAFRVNYFNYFSSYIKAQLYHQSSWHVSFFFFFKLGGFLFGKMLRGIITQAAADVARFILTRSQ